MSLGGLPWSDPVVVRHVLVFVAAHLREKRAEIADMLTRIDQQLAEVDALLEEIDAPADRGGDAPAGAGA